MFRKLIVVLTLIAILTVAAVPAFAQSAAPTRTLTEDQINDSYRVTNPWRRSVTDMSVDLQPDQAVISATVTLRGKDPVAVLVTMTPYIENSRLFWNVEAVTRDGEAVSQELLDQINASIYSSWRNYVRREAKSGHVGAVTISDTEITVTLTR